MSDIGFEDVFGFRPPTEEEAEAAAYAAYLRISNNGDPTGMIAFFSAQGVRENSMAFIEGTASSISESRDIDIDGANLLVYAGFIAAIEYMAAIRLSRSE